MAAECPITSIRFTRYGNDLAQTLKRKAWQNCTIGRLFLDGQAFSIPKNRDEFEKMRKAFSPLKGRMIESPIVFINNQVFDGSPEQITETAMLMAFIQNYARI